MLLAIAILSNSLVNDVRSYSESQNGQRIGGKIVEGNRSVLVVKRSNEQEVTCVVYIECSRD